MFDVINFAVFFWKASLSIRIRNYVDAMSNEQELFGNADVGSLINFGLSIKNVEGPKKRIILILRYSLISIKFTLSNTLYI